MVEQKIDLKIVISDESDNFLQEFGQVSKSRVQSPKSIEKTGHLEIAGLQHRGIRGNHGKRRVSDRFELFLRKAEKR